MLKSSKSHSTWTWIPSLYFAEGVPYVIVMSIAVILYKRLGLDNTSIALYTSWLYLPWVIKPFWSPVVDMFRTRRWWILAMQVLLGASMAGIAFTLPTTHFVQATLAFFWLMAFSSATHDIAADGFYMLALNEEEQTFNVGIRSTFYRIATIATQGGLVYLAGRLEIFTQNPTTAWMMTLGITSALFFLLWAWHFFFLPRPDVDINKNDIKLSEFLTIFIDFFKKPEILTAIAFMLLYRLPEALLVKICPLFMLDPIENGGLGLTTEQIGIVHGTVGVTGLTVGGILGGIAMSKWGFKRLLWPCVLCMSLPNFVYILLAWAQYQSLWTIGSCIVFEHFGYGFGFTAYMMYLIHFSKGPSSTAHYAFCTGFMALSMMIPGMFAGWLQTTLGYLNFFTLVMALVPLTFIAAALISKKM